jgi:hypothetical protein
MGSDDIEFVDDKLFELIADVTTLALNRQHPLFEIFLEQWNVAKKYLRQGKLEFTGVGFYYSYLIPEPVTKLSIRRWVISDISGWVNEESQAAFFNIFIEDGLLKTLEGCVIDEWPQAIHVYGVSGPFAKANQVEREIQSLISKNPGLACELQQLQRVQKPT